VQHLLKREHPTGTERKILNEECGRKDGDSARLGSEPKTKQTQGTEKPS